MLYKSQKKQTYLAAIKVQFVMTSVRKVLYCVGIVYDGVSKVYCVKIVSDGVTKVSEGVRKVSDHVRKAGRSVAWCQVGVGLC